MKLDTIEVTSHTHTHHKHTHTTHTHTHTHTQINYSRSWCLKINKMPPREARQKNRNFINEFMLSERMAVPVFQEYTSVRGMSNKCSLTCRRQFRGITERRTLNLLKLLEFIHQKKVEFIINEKLFSLVFSSPDFIYFLIHSL